MKSRKEIEQLSTVMNSKKAPNTSYVYFLIDKGDIVYVGITKDVGGRLMSHLSSVKVFDAYYFEPVSTEDAYKAESDYINKFKPKYNKRPGYKTGTIGFKTKRMLQWIDEPVIDYIVEKYQDVLSPYFPNPKSCFYSTEDIENVLSKEVDLGVIKVIELPGRFPWEETFYQHVFAKEEQHG